IVAVEVPVRRSGQYTDYRKFTGTLVEDWPLVSLCVDLHEGAGSISQAAVTVGALGETICRLPAVEEWLHGRTRDEVELGLDDLREPAQSHVQAKDDHLASADYKRKVFAAELGRALRGWIAATGMEVDR